MSNHTTPTITNPAGVRRLVVALWSRYLTVISLDGTREDKNFWDGLIEGAHIALSALGASVPPAPFGLKVLISEAVAAAGTKPPATAHLSLGIWREQLTDSIMAKLVEA